MKDKLIEDRQIARKRIERIRGTAIKPYCERLAGLEAEITRLREGLEAAKRSHEKNCPSTWHMKCSEALFCTCGASRDNAAIDALLEKKK